MKNMTTSLQSVLWNLACLIVVLFSAMYVYCKWRYQYWKKKNLPFIEATIPFGSVDNPFTGTIYFGEQTERLYKKAKKKGWRHCGIYVFTIPVYFIIDLEILKNVLAKDFQHFVDRHMYMNEKDHPLSAHLFTITGKKWRNLRTKLTPVFTTGRLKSICQSMENHGLGLQKYFEENIHADEAIHIKDILARFSTDLMTAYAFGLECNSLKEPNTPFRVYGKRIFTFTKLEALKLVFCFCFPSIGNIFGWGLHSKSVTDFFYNVVIDTVDYREKNNIVSNDFMQMLIDLKNKETTDGKALTIEEIAAETFLFFAAGVETSSSTMTYALFELAKRSDLQEKAREEISTVLERHDNKLTYESLSELKYIRQIIDEVLRRYPPFTFVTRICTEDYKVPGENLVIEKGTKVVIPIRGIHFDEEYYENPDEFDPERFTEKRKRQMNRYTYIPFGEGPRICIGERFGILQIKVGLTSILQKFRVTLDKETEEGLKRTKNTITDSDILLNFERLH